APACLPLQPPRSVPTAATAKAGAALHPELRARLQRLGIGLNADLLRPGVEGGAPAAPSGCARDDSHRAPAAPAARAASPAPGGCAGGPQPTEAAQPSPPEGEAADGRRRPAEAAGGDGALGDLCVDDLLGQLEALDARQEALQRGAEKARPGGRRPTSAAARRPSRSPSLTPVPDPAAASELPAPAAEPPREQRREGGEGAAAGRRAAEAAEAVAAQHPLEGVSLGAAAAAPTGCFRRHRSRRELPPALPDGGAAAAAAAAARRGARGAAGARGPSASPREAALGLGGRPGSAPRARA
ncbi:unnamed protein product, partial [Prorocentrum cordatum]